MALLENIQTKGDPVHAGEQWFLYWKTSAALWEARILETSPHHILYIPLYWGFHAENLESWDFGHSLPERDIGRLVHLLTQHGRKFCFLIPLTPAPFLPNGGVPVQAARTLSLSQEGVHLSSLDQEGKLNKMYSFFEPKVFQSFVSFLSSFGNFMGTRKLKVPVWGVKFTFQEEGTQFSYLLDRSLAFEQGFARYLKKSNPNGVELNHPAAEEKIKQAFSKEVEDLFSTTGESALSPFWMGIKDISVLGGSPRETIERGLSEGKTQYHYFNDLFQLYVRGDWVTTSLLTAEEKKDLLPKFLLEHFGADEGEHKFKFRVLSGELDSSFRPYAVVDIFDEGRGFYERNGLIPYLNSRFRWMYQVHRELPFTHEWIDAHHHQIKFFHGSCLDRTRFGQMLKLFMMGQKVILDKTGLHPDLEKRLQIFYLENNLKLQTVNYFTTVNLCELGEGKFFTCEGEKLIGSPEKEKFWAHILKTMKLMEPEVIMDQEVFSLWRIRATGNEDLNYLDVRRLNLYNPTSYKRLVTIRTQRHFAFMKTVDPHRAEVRSTMEGVDVELFPNGRVALDFGHYEEV